MYSSTNIVKLNYETNLICTDITFIDVYNYISVCVKVDSLSKENTIKKYKKGNFR